ncbi:MAG: General stress protein [Berkelbacteria bacterium GW2011_GWB1_38_5]|uniref:General stress protein n=2 Tax=Candidatus Berkelbacteria TaxID=1618330 RepID=A0A0G0LS94_9BACT|nr:MAG: General stress protein [Berkelbacteria bacterium GW2011_GWB1_38_5]KKQ90845.1 MAG: General stress protein [Berkelbacteria bacterium GW2011_GWA1_39_10]
MTRVRRKKEQTELSVREAGKLGGNTTKQRYGRKYYQRIGRKGGMKTKENHGPNFYREIGCKGGAKMKATRSQEYFSEIGKRGSKVVSDLIAKGRKATT